jgi:hypothetical protein
MVGQWGALLIASNLLASFVVPSGAAWVKGEKYVPANGAVFIAKYCFDFDPHGNNTGEVDFRLNSVDPQPVAPDNGLMKIVLLDDQSDSYPDSNYRWPGFDCGDERLNVAAKAQLDIQLKDMPRNNRLHTYIVERIRPRFWFLAAIDCSGVGRTIEYEAHLVNIEKGWMAEISMDRCGITSLIVFIAIYLGAAMLQVRAVFSRSEANTKHPLRLLLTLGTCAAFWGTGFYALDTFFYASRGDETFLLYFAAKFFKACSKFSLLSIMMLLSKGICISRMLHLRDLVHTITIVAPFSLICLGVECYGEYDQATKFATSFVYCGWVGAVLSVADLSLLCKYAQNLMHTYLEEKDSEKKNFYRTWGLVYSSAFFVLPIAIIVSMILAAHVRVGVMFWFNNSVHSVLLLLLIAGLWPERTQEVFCIDNAGSMASIFGNQVGSPWDEEMKGGSSNYEDFNLEKSILADSNIS